MIIRASARLAREFRDHVRATQVNIPKFLDGDLPLFRGIISDLFPGKKRPELDYGALVSVMQSTIDKHGLQPHPWFMGKVIELYEMIVRLGVRF